VIIVSSGAVLQTQTLRLSHWHGQGPIRPEFESHGAEHGRPRINIQGFDDHEDSIERMVLAHPAVVVVPICTTRYNTHVIPFRVEFRPGTPLYDQVVYAAKRALVSGRLRPGDPFPSVRTLSAELKINPNTAHKVISSLLNERLLEVMPGTGTVVARLPMSSAAERSLLLEDQVEQLVVEAKRLGLRLSDVSGALARHWDRLEARDDGAKISTGKGARRSA
jgi:GntR family transcriptional regulator